MAGKNDFVAFMPQISSITNIMHPNPHAVRIKIVGDRDSSHFTILKVVIFSMFYWFKIWMMRRVRKLFLFLKIIKYKGACKIFEMLLARLLVTSSPFKKWSAFAIKALT
jgi:hypothetical protein